MEKNTKKGFSFTRALVAGAVSGFLFEVAYYGMSIVLFSLINYYLWNAPSQILLQILSFIVYVLSLFSLPYYLYSKFSKTEGIVAGITAIIAGFIYTLIIAFLFYSPRL